jgi:hypothetical protein
MQGINLTRSPVIHFTLFEHSLCNLVMYEEFSSYPFVTGSLSSRRFVMDRKPCLLNSFRSHEISLEDKCHNKYICIGQTYLLYVIHTFLPWYWISSNQVCYHVNNLLKISKILKSDNFFERHKV